MRIISIILLTICTTFLGCKNADIDPSNGILTGATFNGKPWENTKLRFVFLQKCESSVDLLIEVSNSQGFNRETFSINKIPIRSGIFDIKKYIYTGIRCLEDSTLNTKKVEVSYLTSQGDGHPGKDVYSVLESNKENNKLIIDKYNNGILKSISGEFNATLLLERKKDGTKYYFDSVDTIRITKARFEASGF